MLALRKKSATLAGLDIGSSSIKLLELSAGSNDEYSLDSYTIVPLPEDAIVEKEIKDVAGLTEAVITALERVKLNSNAAALAMPSSLVITKIIQMDAVLKDTELESQIQLDANRYIPYPLEEVSLDFEVLGPNEKDETKIDVLLAASRTEQMEQRVDAVEEAGLKIKVVDVESYALERILPLIAKDLPDGGEDQMIALMNIGGTVSSLSVFENLQLIYTREEAFGGKQLTDNIRGRFDLDYDQAEYAKREGGLPEEYAMDCLEPFKESVATQVSNAMQFYFSASDDSTIDHIILAGGTASLPGLVELVAARTGINVSVANPFQHMKVNPRINADILSVDAPSLLISCGLALRSFDK